MSWGTPKIPQTKPPAGLDADSLNTNQEGIPVPCMWGRRKIALTWHTPVYNQVNEAIRSQAGKGQESTVTGWNYYIDIAGLICMCGRVKLKKIFKHIFNLEGVWKNEAGLERGDNDYDAISIVNFGQTWIGWGGEDQPIDTHVLTPRATPPGGLPPGFNPRDPGTWPDSDQTIQHPEP
jgi:hypothetical protein